MPFLDYFLQSHDRRRVSYKRQGRKENVQLMQHRNIEIESQRRNIFGGMV